MQPLQILHRDTLDELSKKILEALTRAQSKHNKRLRMRRKHRTKNPRRSMIAKRAARKNKSKRKLAVRKALKTRKRLHSWLEIGDAPMLHEADEKTTWGKVKTGGKIAAAMLAGAGLMKAGDLAVAGWKARKRQREILKQHDRSLHQANPQWHPLSAEDQMLLQQHAGQVGPHGRYYESVEEGMLPDTASLQRMINASNLRKQKRSRAQ